MLIITDYWGTPLACNKSVGGNHKDTFSLFPRAKEIVPDLEAVEIGTDGLFLNTDSGFDTEDFRPLDIPAQADPHARHKA